MKRAVLCWLLFTLAACGDANKGAPVLHIATASNFRPTLERIVVDFPMHCGGEVVISAGSTGHLAAQILNNAPYEVFIAAGSDVPNALATKNRVQSRAVFAYGALVYWMPKANKANAGALALANPEIAPYGRAAAQALKHMDKMPDWSLPPQRVMGKSAAQAYAFVASGAARAGLVPLSLVMAAQVPREQFKSIPQAWYEKIPNEVLVLQQSPLAQCFYGMLGTPQTAAILVHAGFEPA